MQIPPGAFKSQNMDKGKQNRVFDCPSNLSKKSRPVSKKKDGLLVGHSGKSSLVSMEV